MDKSIGSNLSRIKVQNQFAIKEIVYKSGPVSRLEIADRLGLTLPTITTNVSSMLKSRLFKEVDGPHEARTIGRRTMYIDMNEDYGLFMGIEIRGSARRGVIVDMRGNIIASDSDEEPYSDYTDAVRSSAKLAASLAGRIKGGFKAVECIGLSMPGIIDSSEKKLVIYPEYSWSDKSVAADFIALSGYGGEVYAENNTISRAYAMSMFHGKSLKGADSMAYLLISSGIGCPLLSGVRSHFGYVTGDGEVGHMVMDPGGPLCICGNNGCLEAYSSERAMSEKAIEAAREGHSEAFSEILSKSGTVSVDDIIMAKKAGDECAASIISEAIRYLGLAVANIDNFVRPECMVIEGRIFDDDESRRLLLDVIHKNLYRGSFSDYRFCFRKSDDFSGAEGASALAIRHYLEAYQE